jgi:hypothetical protein
VLNILHILVDECIKETSLLLAKKGVVGFTRSHDIQHNDIQHSKA